jgi:hypothetical protein
MSAPGVGPELSDDLDQAAGVGQATVMQRLGSRLQPTLESRLSVVDSHCACHSFR